MGSSRAGAAAAPATPNFRTADAEFEGIDIVAQPRCIATRSR